MTLRAHRDAFTSSLQGDLSGSVFESYSAADLERYAVVFSALSRKDRTRYTGLQIRDTYTMTVHSVGVDEDSCLWVLERVNKVTNRNLSVAGRVLRPVEYVTGQPPGLADDGPNPLWFAVSQFDIISDPA